MKILEPGTGKKEWTLIKNCDSCGAKLLLDKNDLYRLRFMNCHAKIESYVSFACLQCNSENKMQTYSIPEEIYNNLPSYDEFVAKEKYLAKKAEKEKNKDLL